MRSTVADDPDTLVEPGRMRRELAEVRRRRYARTSEEMSPGAASLAVPVQVERRTGPVVVAALGIVVRRCRGTSPRWSRSSRLPHAASGASRAPNPRLPPTGRFRFPRVLGPHSGPCAPR